LRARQRNSARVGFVDGRDNRPDEIADVDKGVRRVRTADERQHTTLRRLKQRKDAAIGRTIDHARAHDQPP